MVDDFALHIVNFCVGVCLVPINIFLLLAITQPNKSIHSAVRRIICHQTILIILMAISLIRASFLQLIDKANRDTSDCLATRVTRMLFEGLVGWGQAALAVYALSLQRYGSVMKNLLSSVPGQVALHSSMWMLVMVEALIIFVPLKANGCEELSSEGYQLQGYCDLASDLVLWATLILYGLRTKRCRLMIGTAESSASSDSTCRQVEELHEKRRRLSSSLVIVCLVVTVLHTAMASFTIYESDRPGGEKVKWSDSFSTMWYASSVSLVVVLAARHADVRQQLKYVVCRKCFLYRDETFQQDMHASVMEQCQTMAAEPHVQARILSDRKKKFSVMSTTPALFRQMSVASGKARFEDSAVSQRGESVKKDSVTRPNFESQRSRAESQAQIPHTPQQQAIVGDPISTNV